MIYFERREESKFGTESVPKKNNPFKPGKTKKITKLKNKENYSSHSSSNLFNTSIPSIQHPMIRRKQKLAEICNQSKFPSLKVPIKSEASKYEEISTIEFAGNATFKSEDQLKQEHISMIHEEGKNANSSSQMTQTEHQTNYSDTERNIKSEDVVTENSETSPHSYLLNKRSSSNNLVPKDSQVRESCLSAEESECDERFAEIQEEPSVQNDSSSQSASHLPGFNFFKKREQKRIREMVLQSKFSFETIQLTKPESSDHQLLSLSNLLKSKDPLTDQEYQQGRRKKGKQKGHMSGQSSVRNHRSKVCKNKIHGFKEYIQKNALLRGYFHRKFTRLSEKLNLRGSYFNPHGITDGSFLAYILMVASDNSFKIGKACIQLSVRNNWLKQKNKLENNFEPASLKKSKYIMYEDYIILKIMDCPGRRKSKIQLISEYIQRTEISIMDHWKILNRAIRESDIRTWLFPLIEEHLGQYSEWVRINYKTLVPEPFMRHDGGVIRFSFHVDQWLLFQRLRKRQYFFYSDPQVHLDEIYYEMFKQMKTSQGLFYDQNTYMKLILCFENYLRKKRSRTDEHIYIDASLSKNASNEYSEKELLKQLEMSTSGLHVSPDKSRDSKNSNVCRIIEDPKTPVLESEVVRQDPKLAQIIKSAMRLKKCNRKGMEVYIFDSCQNILTRFKRAHESLRIKSHEQQLLIHKVLYETGVMEKYRNEMKGLLSTGSMRPVFVLKTIKRINNILRKIKVLEPKQRDKEFRTAKIINKISRIEDAIISGIMEIEDSRAEVVKEDEFFVVEA